MSNEEPFDDETKAKVRDFFKFCRETKSDLSLLSAKLGPSSRRRGPRTKLPRCPKCSQRPIEYIEVWRGHSIRFGIDDSGAPEERGNLHDGEPYSVEAECACGNRWKLKGVTQITDLEGLLP
jgi:hypothetical protein